MYDFRIVKADRDGFDSFILAAPAELISDLDADPRSSLSYLFGFTIDENGRIKDCENGENPTHYVNSMNPDWLDPYVTTGYISIVCGKSKLSRKLKKTHNIAFFYKDVDGRVYTTLANGSRHYLIKDPILKGKDNA